MNKNKTKKFPKNRIKQKLLQKIFYRKNMTLKDMRIFAPQDFSPFLEKNYPNPPG